MCFSQQISHITSLPLKFFTRLNTEYSLYTYLIHRRALLIFLYLKEPVALHECAVVCELSACFCEIDHRTLRLGS